MNLLVGIWYDLHFTMSRESSIDNPQDAAEYLANEFRGVKELPDEILLVVYGNGGPYVARYWLINHDYSCKDNDMSTV